MTRIQLRERARHYRKRERQHLTSVRYAIARGERLYQMAIQNLAWAYAAAASADAYEAMAQKLEEDK